MVPREITSHAVNPANEALLVQALDGPGPGGASHEYRIAVRSVDDPKRDDSPGQPRELAILRFQNGAVKVNGEGVNGITHEALIAIIIDRLDAFQAGPYANVYNADAVTALVAAKDALHRRTIDREKRGVEGTHTV